MRYLSEDEATQMMGVGYLGEVRQGPGGNLYQYVQGVDGLGNPIGFWRRLKRLARQVVSKALPIAQQVAPFIPVPGAAAALTAVTPFLKQAGVAGYEGLGALYQAPDGSLYQVQGLAEDEELRGIGEDEMTRMMGVGYLGEIRQGPDGNLYQWKQGVDGLGNPVGIWGKLRKLARRALKYHPVAAALRAARPLVQKALPIAQQVAPFIPGGVLRGLDEDEELRGLDEDEELRGFAEDEELRGLEEDEELRGFAEDEELRGFAEEKDLRGFAEDEELRGLGQGYVREPGASGLEAYVPQTPPQTRWFTPPAQPPELWRPLW